jgi:outer membrane immunogenic protein
MNNLYFQTIYTIIFITLFFSSSVIRAETANWQGFYLGGNVGYGKNELSGVWDSAGSVFPLSELDDDDFIAGGHVGYNFQNGRYVFGIEGSIANSWLETTGDEDVIIPDSSEGNIHDFETVWFATIRGRAGLAFEQYLFYVTAGVAYVESELRVEQDESNATPDRVGIDSWGGAFGAGLEYSFNQNLSLRAEGQYLLLDDEKSLDRASLNDSDTDDFIDVEDILLFQVGVSYRF